MNFDQMIQTDDNGTDTRMGWDEHGWFTIEQGEEWHVDGERGFESHDRISLTPDTVERLKEAFRAGEL